MYDHQSELQCDSCHYRGSDALHPLHCCMCGRLHATDYTCEPQLNYTIEDREWAFTNAVAKLAEDPENKTLQLNKEWWLNYLEAHSETKTNQ